MLIPRATLYQKSHAALSFPNSQSHLLSGPYMETLHPEELVTTSLSEHSQAILCSVLLQTLAASALLFLCVKFLPDIISSGRVGMG